MKKIFFILLLVIANFCNYTFADDNIHLCKRQYSSPFFKSLSDDLSFAENQIFNKNYNKDALEERLERLELKVYGAIQDGNTLTRISNIKNALTNVSQGGNGLQYSNKLFDLAGNSISSSNWNIGNNNYYQPHYSYNHNNRYSHRLPPPRHYHSRRLPPRSYSQNYNYNPIGNGDFTKNYSIGTGIKILNDD